MWSGKEVRMKKRAIGLNLLLMALFLNGCNSTEETAMKNQITISSYDAADMAFEYVKRGDLDTGETVFLNLLSSETAEYSFEQSGLMIEKVYVAEGDAVTSGMLLAEADNEDIKMNLSKTLIEVESLRENIEYYSILLQDMKKKNEGKTDKEKANLDEIGRYELKIAQLNDTLLSTENRVSEWQEKLKKTQIYAGMDGSVEYVGEYGNGLVSDDRMPFIRLRTEEEVFTGNIAGRQEFVEGQEISIIINDAEYDSVITAVEYQNEETLIRVVTKEYVDLNDVTFAEFVWNQEHLSDVLYVPVEAVVTINGEDYVYVFDEKGFPDPVKVVVGKKGSRFTSIEEGIAEGERIKLF